MLFEIESRGFCISNNLSTPRRLFCNKHESKYFISILPRQQNSSDRSFSSIIERRRSICNKTVDNAVLCCTLVCLGCRRLIFFLKRNRLYSFNLMCECLNYILIRLSAINIVDYLHVYLSTICFIH